MNRNQNDPRTNQRPQDDQAGQRQTGRPDISQDQSDEKGKQPGNPQAQNDPRKQGDQGGRQQTNVEQDDAGRKSNQSQPDSQKQGQGNDQQRR